MEKNVKDLWPDKLTMTDQLPPIAILRRQAAALATKTKGLVEAEVRKYQAPEIKRYPLFADDPNTFYWEFILVAPALDDYQVPLFLITHELDFYPLWIYPKDGNRMVAQSEEEFLDHLSQIFASEKTLKTIRALLTQSQAFEEIPA